MEINYRPSAIVLTRVDQHIPIAPDQPINSPRWFAIVVAVGASDFSYPSNARRNAMAASTSPYAKAADRFVHRRLTAAGLGFGARA